MREIDGGKARTLAEFPELRPVTPQLDIYETLLRRWQNTVNIVGASTVHDIWWRHFADSAQIWSYAKEERLLDVGAHIDLGSGGGFPGLIFALLNKAHSPLSETTLVESDTRKAAFLREVSRETGAAAQVITTRAEDIISSRAAPTLLTSRAFMLPGRQIALIRPWLDAGTTAILLAGEPVESQDLHLTATPSRTGPGFVLMLRRLEAERP